MITNKYGSFGGNFDAGAFFIKLLICRPGCIWNGHARIYMDLRETELVSVDLIHVN